ncbi:MAG: monomethylamine:corrinoid methyltransferase [Chloroflexi bacterium]|nr:monomethylamine:corrinoid methyltransferase [Chloroflexota bacterium]
MSLTMRDVWARAETGPICPTQKFELKVLFPEVKKLVGKYDIKYNPESPVPLDDKLIDRVFQAGLELLTGAGVLCTDTERIIQFEEQEVRDTIRFVSGEVTLGEGKDAVVMAHRGIEDRRLPVIWGGPVAVPVSENIMIKAYESYAREPSLDAFWTGTLSHIGSMPVKSGSPLEMHAEKINVGWSREAFRRAGRPGLHLSGSSAVTPRAPIGACNPEYGYRKSDSIHCYMVVNMKTDYDTMSRAEHYHAYGCLVWGGGTTFIGGLAGGPEGAAITAVAELLATYMIYRADILLLWTPTANYAPGMASRRAIWATSLASSSVARNTNFAWLNASPYQAYAGPCTDMYLYEIAAPTIAFVTCGGHPIQGGGRQGGELDYFGGPLDTRFLRDVAYATTRLNRSQANTIVKAILARYEDRIKAKDPPVGKRFQECNDLDTLRPTQEYLDLYHRVKEELSGLGLEFK